MNRRFRAVAILLLTVALAWAKSSKLVMSWTNPNHTPGKQVQRVLALGLSNQTEIRADFEDALAAQLTEAGMETIPGNTILLSPEGTQVDLNYLKTQIRANKIDAAVVSRLIKVEKTVRTSPAVPTWPPSLTTTRSTATTVRYTRLSMRPTT